MWKEIYGLGILSSSMPITYEGEKYFSLILELINRMRTTTFEKDSSDFDCQRCQELLIQCEKLLRIRVGGSMYVKVENKQIELEEIYILKASLICGYEVKTFHRVHIC